jgi:predicted DNA-binding protein
MGANLQAKTARLNVQVSLELKDKLINFSAFQGKRVSTLVREALEEKVAQIDNEIFEKEMKQAYQGLAKENIRISDDFKYVDSENL